MDTSFDNLIDSLSKSLLSTDILHQITLILMQQTEQSLSSFVSQSFPSLLILEQWTWQLLSQDSLQWINQPCYQQLFHTLASFNKMLIFTYEKIEDEIKASLLIPETIDQLKRIFKHIEQYDDDNILYNTFVSLWFDNHSYFLHNNSHYGTLPVIDGIGEYFARNYMMNQQFKFYLSQLRQPQIAQEIFTAKMLFYVKTCSFYLHAYLEVKADSFCNTANEIARYIGDDYLQIVHIHSYTVSTWTNELISCITHLIAFMTACFSSDEQKEMGMKILFPTEQIICEHVQDLIRIIIHKPLYEHIKSGRFNNETILLDAILITLVTIVKTQNINWFFRSNTQIQEILLTVAEVSLNDKICLHAYAILTIVLTDEQLKELKIADSMPGFLFNTLEQAWQHPSKKYKHIPIVNLLRGFRNISKSDSFQQKTADLKRTSLLIDMCDQYSIVYDVLWALSFNQDIQQQLRSNSSFLSKLSHRINECGDDEQLRKVVYGILWNLEINHDDRSISVINGDKKFDIMISYSHKEKIHCKQLYEELTKAGYRVWIDFDQMHGNVMDTMAQAIDQSHTIIICISEQYRRSNYCRAEAHYAFQRQRKIVPVLLQKHYKPDGWLLFLTGQLLYVDFIKYEFPRAMELLFKELHEMNFSETNIVPVRPKEDIAIAAPVLSQKAFVSPVRPQDMLEWTQTHVQDWLIEHKLIQMSHLLADCDGRSLVYLSKYMKHTELRHILTSFREDSLRRINQSLSYIELSRFQSLMDQKLWTKDEN